MKQDFSDTELRTIREGIRSKYTEVAQAGTGCCFQYPTGKEGLLQLGYPAEVLQGIPGSVLATFCGVGNPFSLGPINPGESVLDVGCGAGLDTLVAARLTGPSGRVCGIDATAPMIARARANLALVGLTNVSLEVASAEALPFAERQFDVLLSNGVFNLTVDKERALREAHRVLKPGGRLMIADMVLVQELPGDQAARVDNWYR